MKKTAQDLVKAAEEAPDLSKLMRPKETPGTRKKTGDRNTQDTVRFLGSHFPAKFANDFNQFHNDHKYSNGRKALTQGQLIEIAFYTLYEQETGKKKPDWVVEL